ncbi:GNAT family N-acetyltransferase [Jannaschia aquimarina]|uniref:Acetyltransferase (GNAT) family protein n=1 Tax=Jannaschia aquimarina TaxID=935700 RepID=A0A0D1CIH8_9RHOB|nr:N-acetyltransferase [Jannaschia aquimarina]KIT14527.1 Acetyltransferase (GNAT) family protein [Jannaschia aquimarina]SNT35676.1 Predicted N-acetyltransferase YhbS [Jannaschia aquimarina]
MKLDVEHADDAWEVEALFDHCFAPGRTALSSYRLRDGIPPARDLCLVARADGTIGGAVRFWPIRVGDHEAMLLGPIAVHPTRQGEGLGAALICEGQERARAAGVERILLVGDAPYYGRFGFARLNGVEMPPPTNPERVLGCWDWDGVTGPVRRAAD